MEPRIAFPKHSIHDLAMDIPRATTAISGQEERFNDRTLRITQFMVSHRCFLPNSLPWNYQTEPTTTTRSLKEIGIVFWERPEFLDRYEYPYVATTRIELTKSLTCSSPISKKNDIPERLLAISHTNTSIISNFY